MGQNLPLLDSSNGPAVPGTELKEADDESSRRALRNPIPWTDLVRRSCSLLQTRSLLAPSWDPSTDQMLEVLDHCESRLVSLSESPESFLALCPASTNFECASAMVPVDWAEALLERSAQLRETRRQLVPRRLKEDVFWDRYFAAIFELLTTELKEVAVASGQA
mmetsp:Transcript_179/g.402  ORF Transcript_179/g.402 Transcript_179/m.402 type:complete len:164 (-) Transcript_179:121-612(-)